MRLRILLPLGVFLDVSDVLAVVLETSEGCLGLLRQRLDFVAVLVPGILAYSTREAGEVFVAVDEGVVVKSGFEVCVTVRQASGGTDLVLLKQRVAEEFLAHTERDKAFRSVMVGLEAAFLHRYTEFSRG